MAQIVPEIKVGKNSAEIKVGRHKSWQTRTFLVFALIYTITIILSNVVLHNIYGTKIGQ